METHRWRIQAGRFLLPLLVLPCTVGRGETPKSADTQPAAVTVVEGQVFNHIGAGVEGATVEVTRANETQEPSAPLATVSSNGTGDFRAELPGVVTGTILLRIAKEGYAPIDREVEIIPNDEFPPFADIQLTGALVLTGSIRDARTGRPVSQASIKASAAFQSWSAESDEDGSFSVDKLPPGQIQVMVEAEGYAREQFGIESVAEAGPQSVALKPERIVHLETVDEAGQPVSGVIVELIDGARQDFRTVGTDAHGKVTVRGLPADAQELAVRLSHDDYLAALDFDQQLELDANAVETTHRLVLRRAATVTGQVLNAATGQPLNGARVMAGELFSERPCRDWTGFEGKYRLHGVEPGRRSVTVHLRGYSPELKEVQVKPGETTTARFRLQPAGLVGGKVVDSDGTPLARVHVFAVQWRGHETLGLQALTDNEGRFVIADAPTDEFLVTLAHPSHRPLENQPVRSPRTDYQFSLTARSSGSGPLPGNQLKIGQTAPPFRVVTLGGQELTLASLKGKTVLLDFWATWCGPCLAELPHLRAVQAALGLRDDFVLIGISLDHDEKALQRFIKENEISWLQACGDDSGASTAADAFAVSSIPATFLIGPSGIIQAIDLRGRDLLQRVQETLQSDAGP